MNNWINCEYHGEVIGINNHCSYCVRTLNNNVVNSRNRLLDYAHRNNLRLDIPSIRHFSPSIYQLAPRNEDTSIYLSTQPIATYGMTYSEVDFFKQLNRKTKIKLYKNSDSINTQCYICLSNLLENDIVRVINCNHSFHQTCIDPWLENSTKCPNCRYDILRNETRMLV